MQEPSLDDGELLSLLEGRKLKLLDLHLDSWTLQAVRYGSDLIDLQGCALEQRGPEVQLIQVPFLTEEFNFTMASRVINRWSCQEESRWEILQNQIEKRDDSLKESFKNLPGTGINFENNFEAYNYATEELTFVLFDSSLELFQDNSFAILSITTALRQKFTENEAVLASGSSGENEIEGVASIKDGELHITISDSNVGHITVKFDLRVNDDKSDAILRLKGDYSATGLGSFYYNGFWVRLDLT